MAFVGLIFIIYDSIFHRELHDNEVHLRHFEVADSYNFTLYKFCIRNNVNFPVSTYVEIEDRCHDKTRIYLDFIEHTDCFAVQLPHQYGEGCYAIHHTKIKTQISLYDYSGLFKEKEKTWYRPIRRDNENNILSIETIKG